VGDGGNVGERGEWSFACGLFISIVIGSSEMYGKGRTISSHCSSYGLAWNGKMCS